MSDIKVCDERPLDDKAFMAFKRVDFDWTASLGGIWQNEVAHVATLNKVILQELLMDVDTMCLRSAKQPLVRSANPLGHVVQGQAGSGKTHFLGSLRRETHARQAFFIFCDLIDISDFWRSLAQAYIESLDQQISDEHRQIDRVLSQLFSSVPKMPLGVLEQVQSLPADKLKAALDKVISSTLRYARPKNTLHLDVLKALLLSSHQDYDVMSVGLAWLQGLDVDANEKQRYGLRAHEVNPMDVVSGISWVMSLAGPTVLAFDQMDAIVSQYHIANPKGDTEDLSKEQRRALSIVHGIAGGLMGAWDKLFNTVSVLVCLETSWCILYEQVLRSVTDRFNTPKNLKLLSGSDMVRAVIESRLNPQYTERGFIPPYSSYPFSGSIICSWSGLTPRQVLRKCAEHQRVCLMKHIMIDLVDERGGHQPGQQPDQQQEETGLPNEPDIAEPSGHDDPIPDAGDSFDRAAQPLLDQLRQKYQHLQQQANLLEMKDENASKENLESILPNVARAFVLQEQDRVVERYDFLPDIEFSGDRVKPLHMRLRVIDHGQGDCEHHHAYRSLQVKNANAFKSRLQAAMIASGIDRNLAFRHLVILRVAALPGGAKTTELIQRFYEQGGVFHHPSDDELRRLWAINQLMLNRPEGLENWLMTDRPLEDLPLFQLEGLPDLLKQCIKPDASVTEAPNLSQILETPLPLSDAREMAADVTQDLKESTSSNATVHKASQAPQPQSSQSSPSQRDVGVDTTIQAQTDWVVLGHESAFQAQGAAVRIETQQLRKHTVVLAGAGSGKTVFVRRLIEEAALQGIPSVVIDGANDLTRLGSTWSKEPSVWNETDKLKAQQYFSQTETVVWTPGRNRGNPLRFEPLPDLYRLREDDDELEQGIAMARSALVDFVASGNSQRAQLKRGVLTSALRGFAQSPHQSLKPFIAFLRDLPNNVGMDITSQAGKLALEMADVLAAEVAQNPLLKPGGELCKPEALFGLSQEKTRVSVVNLLGIAGKVQQEQFVGQLAMNLFTWMRKNPAPSNKVGGLIVIDEAADFVPSGRSGAAKDPLIRLAAQARKYGFGLVFATQAPKSIDHRVIANASTQLYGKASSPAAVNVIREQIQQRGGGGHDVAKLAVGQFYVYSDGFSAPKKIQTPLCLSQHPSSPPSEEEVLMIAQQSRKQLSKSDISD